MMIIALTESVGLSALLVLVLFGAVCQRYGQEFIVQYLLAPSGCSLVFIVLSILTRLCLLRYLALFLGFNASCKQIFRCRETLVASILILKTSLLIDLGKINVIILVHNILLLP